MIAKKNPKYELENKRKLYFNLGLLVAGSITLAAFRYGSPMNDSNISYEPEKKLITETYEIRKTIESKKATNTTRPQKPEIFNPEKVKPVDQVVKDNKVVTNLVDIPFIDFTDGQKGLGEYGIDESIETIDSEFATDVPLYPGGDSEMITFIQKKFKFPAYMDFPDQGTIYVKFTVSSKGEIVNPTIEKGLSTDLDKEAIRVVSAMPNWEPGKYRGRAVNVRIIIPIKIKLSK